MGGELADDVRRGQKHADDKGADDHQGHDNDGDPAAEEPAEAAADGEYGVLMRFDPEEASRPKVSLLQASGSELSDFVQTRLPRIRGCYETALERDPDLAGTMSFSLRADAQGALDTQLSAAHARWVTPGQLDVVSEDATTLREGEDLAGRVPFPIRGPVFSV